MTEQIGVKAIFDLSGFSGNVNIYARQVKMATGATEQAERATKSAGLSFGQMATKLAALGATFGIVDQAQRFVSVTYEMARSQNDARNALTQLVGSADKYREAIQQVQTATRGTLSETEAAQTAFGLLDNGIAKTAEEAAQYALAGKALNSALGQTASYEKFLMLLDEGSPMLLNNFNITGSMIDAQQKLVEANTNLTGSEARLQAVREVALQKGLALADSISQETIAAQQATAAYADFQAAFGQLVISLDQATGVTTLATAAFVQLKAGAEAWNYVLNEAIPTIDQHNTALAQQAAQDALSAKSQEELAAAWEAGRSDFDAFTSALAQGASSVDEYNRIVTEGAQGNYILAQSLTMTADEFNAAKSAMMAAAQVAEQNAYQSMRNLTAATYEAATATRTLSAEQKQLAGQAGVQAGAFGGQMDTFTHGRMLAGLQTASDKRLAYQEAQQKEEEKAASELEKLQQRGAKAMTKSFDQAAQQIRSTIESVLQPTLDEVWKPPEGAEVRIDEAARRLATVTTAGFGSEWLNSLNTQFAGQDFWKPMADAMASGDVGALKNAANSILMGNVTQLWDVEAIKQKVREQLQQQNLRQAIIDQVQTELATEGMTVSPEQVAQIAGGVAGVEQGATGAGAAVAGIATDAGTTQTALDTLGLSLDTVSTVHIPAMITASGDLVLAIQGIGTGISEASPGIQAAMSTTVKDLQKVITIVKWPDLGKSIDEGVAKGISQNEHLVIEKLKELMRSALASAQTEIGYGSPAKAYIPLGQSIPQALALGTEKDSGLFTDALDKLFGIDQSAIKDLAHVARGASKIAFSSFITDSKAAWAQGFLEKAFRGNAKEILSATDKMEAFREVVKRAGVDWEQMGFSGTWSGTIDSAMSAFLEAFDKAQVKSQAKFQAQVIAGAKKAIEMGGGIIELAQAQAGVLDKEVDQLAYLINTATDGQIDFNGQILNTIDAQGLLNQKMEEQTSIQDDLLRLQQGQARLNLLQQQLDLINQLNKVGLDTQSILGSLIGPNASMGDIVEASNRAIEALIQYTQSNLRSAVPGMAAVQVGTPVSGTQNISNRSSNVTINGLNVSNGMDVNNLIALIQRTAAGVA